MRDLRLRTFDAERGDVQVQRAVGRAACAAALGIWTDRSRDAAGHRTDEPEVSIRGLDVEEAAAVDCDPRGPVHRAGDSVDSTWLSSLDLPAPHETERSRSATKDALSACASTSAS